MCTNSAGSRKSSGENSSRKRVPYSPATINHKACIQALPVRTEIPRVAFSATIVRNANDSRERRGTVRTLAIATPLSAAKAVPSFSYTGASDLQCPHHGAKNSTSTSFDGSMAMESKVSTVRSSTSDGGYPPERGHTKNHTSNARAVAPSARGQAVAVGRR